MDWEASAHRVAAMTRPTPGKDRRIATSVGSDCVRPCSLVSDPDSVSWSRTASIRAAISSCCCRTRRSLGNQRRACSLAALTLPGASVSGGTRRTVITCSAVNRRIRCLFHSCPIRLRVNWRAASGFGALSSRSHTHASSAAELSCSNCGK